MSIEKFSYDNKIVKYFIIATVVFGVVAMSVGLTIATQLFILKLTLGYHGQVLVVFAPYTPMP